MTAALAAPAPGVVADDVAQALAEDLGDGDRTAALIPADARLETRVIARETAVLCGAPWFIETFRRLDAAVAVSWQADEGAIVHHNQEVCRLEGPARAVLSGERTALNFLQTLSGTATQARRFVDAVAGTGATILDTRKTLPGLRIAQKYAVRCGGASNHRIGLFDAILVKENHISAAGSITAAVREALRLYPELPLEVEVEDTDQLEEAMQAGARRVLLDNFSLRALKAAVERYHGRIELEASGGIDLQSVRAVAETGVDFISVGDLTKNVDAIDFSMRFLPT
ncbi:MAG: carboxylating nicotinate-nucleotide diphosphorylase [Xanthomonadales bacterium]|nr:carboxylating nicotinate-nucleotide diphosphorylase [Xanthomonadales bacterium]